MHQLMMSIKKPGEFEPEQDDFIINPHVQDKPDCTDNKHCCALYGIRFIDCICKVIPVNKCNLSAFKEDCYFATENLFVEQCTL
jgi:hypothetical protein